jgi:hypothetical protein
MSLCSHEKPVGQWDSDGVQETVAGRRVRLAGVLCLLILLIPAVIDSRGEAQPLPERQLRSVLTQITCRSPISGWKALRTRLPP